MFDSIDDTVTFAQASAGVLCYVLPLLQLLQTNALLCATSTAATANQVCFYVLCSALGLCKTSMADFKPA
jgi:hypothetical protein